MDVATIPGVNRHQCFAKWAAGPTCVGDDCFGIDMHTGLNRCFLNGVEPGPTDTMSCEEYVVQGKLTPFPTYELIYKQKMPEERRATATAKEASARSLLPAIDQGKSWNQILRFNDITFKTGGKFKACFCDPDTLAPGKYCNMASDYKLEIGTVHVSGVSCLVEDEKFQRGTCVGQYYGGLRCYPDKAPKLKVPTVKEMVVP